MCRLPCFHQLQACKSFQFKWFEEWQLSNQQTRIAQNVSWNGLLFRSIKLVAFGSLSAIIQLRRVSLLCPSSRTIANLVDERHDVPHFQGLLHGFGRCRTVVCKKWVHGLVSLSFYRGTGKSGKHQTTNSNNAELSWWSTIKYFCHSNFESANMISFFQTLHSWAKKASNRLHDFNNEEPDSACSKFLTVNLCYKQ